MSRDTRRFVKRIGLAALLVGVLCCGGSTSVVVEVALEPGVTTPDGWPLTTGVPLKKGVGATETTLDAWGLQALPSNELVPVQLEVRGLYPATSHVRWLGASFQAKPGATSYKLRKLQSGETAPSHPTPVVVDEQPGWIDVTNGPLAVRIPTAGPRLISFVELNGVAVLEDREVSNYYVHADGRVFEEGNLQATVERLGPLHTTVRVDGDYLDPDTGAQACYFTARLHFYAGRPVIGITHTFTWIGSQDELQIRELGLRFAPVATQQAAADASADLADGWVAAGLDDQDRLSLYQDVHAHWDQDTSHYAVELQETAGTLTLAQGARAGHWVSAGDGAVGVTLALKELWQQFPKALRVDHAAGTLEALLWAPEGGDLDLRLPALEQFWGPYMVGRLNETGTRWNNNYLDVQNDPQRLDPTGLAKTHDLLLIFHAGPADAAVQQQADAFAHPPLALPRPTYIAGTGVIGGLTARNDARYPELEANLDRNDSDALNIMDEWGDYGFHAYGQGPHANYQQVSGIDVTLRADPWRYSNVDYNYELGIWRSYFRTGDPALFRAAAAHTRHVNDLMLNHDDRSPRRHVGDFQFNPGLEIVPWISWTAPSKGWQAMIAGFGFSIEHALWHYYLTGDLRSLEVFDEYADALQQMILDNGDANFAAQQAAASFSQKSRWHFSQMDNLAVSYLHRGDPWYRDRAIDLANEFLKPDQVGGMRFEPVGSGDPPLPRPTFIFYKVPNILSYMRVVAGDDLQKAEDSLRKMAEYTYVTYTEGRATQESRGIGPTMAKGHELTQDPKYLAFGLDILRQRHNALIHPTGVPAEDTGTLYYTLETIHSSLLPQVNSNDPDADVNRSGVLKSKEASMNGPYLMQALDGVSDVPTRDLLYAHYVSGDQGAGLLPLYHKPYFLDHPFALPSPAVTLTFAKAAGEELVVEFGASSSTTARPSGAPFEPTWFGPDTLYTVGLDPDPIRLANPIRHTTVAVPAGEPAGDYTITCPQDHLITVFSTNASFTVQ